MAKGNGLSKRGETMYIAGNLITDGMKDAPAAELEQITDKPWEGET